MSTSPRSPGQRQLRVAEQVRHALASVLREAKFRDPDLEHPEMITLSSVEIGPDLKHAYAYVLPLGGENTQTIVNALNRAAGYLRGELGRRLDMRYTPHISFRADNSFDNASHIEALIKKAHDDLPHGTEDTDDTHNNGT